MTRLSWVAPHGMAYSHWVRQDCDPCDQIGWFSVIMVLVCLPSDALSQHPPSYLGFSYLGCGVSLHGCSSKALPLLLTLEEGYLLMAAPPDLEHGVAPLSPPAPRSSRSLLLGRGEAPLGRGSCAVAAWRSRLLPLTLGEGCLVTATLLHFCAVRCSPEKHLFLLYWLCQSLRLCGSQ